MDLEEVQKSITALDGATKEHLGKIEALVEKQGQELKELGKTREETGAEISKATEQLDAMSAELEGLKSALGENADLLGKTQEFLDELEKSGQRPGWGDGDTEGKSLGETFTESDQYARFLKAKSNRSDAIQFELNDFSNSGLARKAPVLSAPSGGGNWQPPQAGPNVWSAKRELQIKDLFDVRPTDKTSHTFVRITGFAADGAAANVNTHGAAAPMAENQNAPEAQISASEETSVVRPIGHFLPISRDTRENNKELAAEIDGNMVYGVKFAAESQILNGSGVTPNLPGILNDPDIQNYRWSSGKPKDTIIDAIRRGINKAHVREYRPTGLIINPNDKTDLDLSKGDDGHYLWFNIQGSGIFRLNFVETNAIEPGTSLAGDFRRGATIWDLQEATLRISEEHADFFRKRMVGLLAEVQMGLGIKIPESFVEIIYDAAPAVP